MRAPGTLLRDGAAVAWAALLKPFPSPAPPNAQTRVADGSRVRGVPTVDPVNIVAWAPHSLMLAYACEDRLSPRPEHNCVRLLVPA